MITTVAGNGVYGFSGDNGPAASAALANPSGVAVDSAGNIYIADADNNCIRKVANGVITTVAGNGTAGFSGDNGPATSAQLHGPVSVAERRFLFEQIIRTFIDVARLADDWGERLATVSADDHSPRM